MATAHVAYKESFGFDAPPYTYADFKESDVLVFVGSNPCIAHPIMWQWVTHNPHQPEIIVVDPRRTETAMVATQHYGIQPKSDLLLLYGLARILIEMGAIKKEFIEAHTTGYEEFAAFVQAFTIGQVVEATGIPEERLRTSPKPSPPGSGFHLVDDGGESRGTSRPAPPRPSSILR